MPKARMSQICISDIKNNSLHASHEQFSLLFFFVHFTAISSYHQPEVTALKLSGQRKHLTTNFHFFLFQL